MQQHRLFLMLLMAWMVFATTSCAQAQGASGLISAVNIQDKTIQIGANTYGIADGVIITSKDNTLLNQLALAPGQQISYELAPQPLDMRNNSPLPSQVITKIQIVSGFHDDGIKH
jgi:hypothetical protein